MNLFSKNISRRTVLRVGVLGAGLALPELLRLQAAGGVDKAKTRSGILVFLKGGPSHMDTFDLKPGAPREYRGDFRPRKTNVPGVEICEHLPRLARCADQFAVVRGLTHNLAAHGLGSRYLLTGNRPLPTLQFPTYGSVLSRVAPGADDLPSFVGVDEAIEGAGYLGAQYSSLNTGEFPRANQPFNVRGLSLDGIDLAQFRKRRGLLDKIDNEFRELEKNDETLRGLDAFSRRAYRIISSPRARAAFDLEQADPALARRFGAHTPGRTMLLASRLVEAGVRFVTVVIGGWDTHSNNFNTLRNTLLPQLDESLSALLGTLSESGRLGDTGVMVTGEFGRTPKVNGRAGRDHWARAMCALLAGGAVKPGQVVGASDAKGEGPDGDGFSPDDLAATFYRSLGIDPKREFRTPSGRPIALVRNGQPIEKLF